MISASIEYPAPEYDICSPGALESGASQRSQRSSWIIGYSFGSSGGIVHFAAVRLLMLDDVLVDKSRRVRQQMVDHDGFFAGAGELRQVLLHGSIQPDEPIVDQNHYRGCGEDLAY